MNYRKEQQMAKRNRIRGAGKILTGAGEDFDVKGLLRYLERRGPELAEKYRQHKQLEQETREPTALQRIAQSFELSSPARPEEIWDYQPGGGNAMAELFGGG